VLDEIGVTIADGGEAKTDHEICNPLIGIECAENCIDAVSKR
jgi:hypothetical protein